MSEDNHEPADAPGDQPTGATGHWLRAVVIAAVVFVALVIATICFVAFSSSENLPFDYGGFDRSPKKK